MFVASFRDRLVSVLVLTVFVFVFVLQVTLTEGADKLDASKFTPVTLKELLRARDLQFDNLTFRIVKRELKSKVVFTEFGEAAPPKGQELTAEVTTEYRVTIRGAETTIDVNETVAGGVDLGFIPQKTRTSNASGKEMIRQVIPRPGGQPPEIRISHNGDQPPNGLLEQEAMFAEFCLGVGYGRRIEEIKSIEQAGDNLKVEATIKMYEGSDELSQATLILDSDFLVRDAGLQTRDEADGLRSEIKTVGVVKGTKPGQVVAKSSSHKRWIYWTDRNAAQRNSLQVNAPYTTQSIKYDLTPAEYAELSRIDIGKDDRVVDTTPMPQVELPAKEIPRTRASNPWLYVVVGNAVILAILGFAMLRRQLSQNSGDSSHK